MAPKTTPPARPALPHPRSFPRETIRSTLQAMIAEGKPPAAITVTQLRMRLGGGSWQTLREELERAQDEDRSGTDASSPQERLAEEVPPPLAGQAMALEQMLERAGAELRALVVAIRNHDRQRHQQEIEALRSEIDELRRQLAAPPRPPRTTAKGRRSGGSAS